MHTRQRARVAYLWAVFCLCSSVLGWTLLLQHLQVQEAMQSLTSAALSLRQESLHAAGGLAGGESGDLPEILPGDGTEDLEQRPGTEESHGVDQTELAQWELTRSFSIAIPAIDVRAPVFVPSRRYWDAQAWDLLEAQMQVGLLQGAAAYPHSSAFLEPGTIFIAGHSSPPTQRAERSRYGDLFARLPEVPLGAEIALVRGAERVTYRVEARRIVPPDATEILKPSGDAVGELVLITCYPVGTTKERFLLIARQTS